MSTLSATDYEQVVSAVRSWPASWRLRLMEAILGSLRQELSSSPAQGVPVEKVLGVAAGSGPPPDDETVQRWLEEHRAEKCLFTPGP